jgi:hypothetical protein
MKEANSALSAALERERETALRLGKDLEAMSVAEEGSKRVVQELSASLAQELDVAARHRESGERLTTELADCKANAEAREAALQVEVANARDLLEGTRTELSAAKAQLEAVQSEAGKWKGAAETEKSLQDGNRSQLQERFNQQLSQLQVRSAT